MSSLLILTTQNPELPTEPVEEAPLEKAVETPIEDDESSESQEETPETSTNLKFDQASVSYIEQESCLDSDDPREAYAIISITTSDTSRLSHVILPDGSILTPQATGQTEYLDSIGQQGNAHSYTLDTWEFNLKWKLPIDESSIGAYTFTLVDENGTTVEETVDVTAEDLTL